MKKLLLSTLAVLALSAAVQTASAEAAPFANGDMLTVVPCTSTTARLYTPAKTAVCVVDAHPHLKL